MTILSMAVPIEHLSVIDAKWCIVDCGCQCSKGNESE